MHLSADSLRALHSLIIISNVALWRYLLFLCMFCGIHISLISNLERE